MDEENFLVGEGVVHDDYSPERRKRDGPKRIAEREERKRLADGDRRRLAERGRRESDPWYVLTSELAPLVHEWLEEHESQHPTAHSRYLQDQFTGLRYLSFHSGVGPRQIWAVVREKQKHVAYERADRILTAMGRPDLLRHLVVVKNPMWSQERWRAYQLEHGGCESDWVGSENGRGVEELPRGVSDTEGGPKTTGGSP